MPRTAQLEGQTFGELTVIERAGFRQYKSGCAFRAAWRCRCTCGKELITTTDMLRKGEAKSCGCKKLSGLKNKPSSVPDPDAALISLFNSYKKNKRDKTFNLTLDFFRELTSKNCFYCDIAPIQIWKPAKKTVGYVYNGLDRVNTKIGYVHDNVVPCCKHCNYAKNSLSKENFFNLVKRIYEHNKLNTNLSC